MDAQFQSPGNSPTVEHPEIHPPILNNIDHSQGNPQEERELDVTEINLEGQQVGSEEEAFRLYNDYAYKMGFSCRKFRVKRRKNDEVYMRQFCCWKQGHKVDKGNVDKCYAKVDFRTGCQATIRFNVDKKGIWTVTRHHREHNHDPCPLSKRHTLPSHRDRMARKTKVNLVGSSVANVDAVEAVPMEVGGSSSNSSVLVPEESLDGRDANSLIEIFKRRQASEPDFFYDYQLNDSGSFTKVFWRDSKMKKDYLLFGDLVRYNSTFRTNKFAMICAPFVGMNHHSKNVVFGCGFMLNEKAESFIWLFKTFLRSMDSIHPKTIMTDNVFSKVPIDHAIKEVFPEATHRLCLWHIAEDSKKNLKHLQAKSGFIELFNYVLTGCSSVEEFNHYWGELIAKYECGTHFWIHKLYNARKRWCPVFSEATFSGGLLSSQGSELASNSISKRMHSTATMCDFYKFFSQVISEWRSKEKEEDLNGESEIPFMSISILSHASSIYTTEIYKHFEDEFKKCISSRQELVQNDESVIVYKVWGTDEKFFHVVKCSNVDDSLTCTCKKFTEVGILCFHILRVMFITCIEKIPSRYILNRWCKNIRWTVEEQEQDSGRNSESGLSPWLIEMMRKISALVSASQYNSKARAIVEDMLMKTKQAVEAEVGPIDFSDSESDSDSDSDSDDEGSSFDEIIENPEPRRKKAFTLNGT